MDGDLRSGDYPPKLDEWLAISERKEPVLFKGHHVQYVKVFRHADSAIFLKMTLGGCRVTSYSAIFPENYMYTWGSGNRVEMR